MGLILQIIESNQHLWSQRESDEIATAQAASACKARRPGGDGAIAVAATEARIRVL